MSADNLADLTVVTGGSSGIGRCLVQNFLETGDVLNIARRPATGGGRSAQHRLYDLTFDLSSTEDIAPALDGWFRGHPGYAVSTLIHNAATTDLGRLSEVSPATISHAFAVNFYAPLTITNALLARGRFSRQGAAVAYIVSSLARFLPELSFSGIGLYSITKAALSRMALIQSREFRLAGQNIRILRIHPGIVDTNLQRGLRRAPDIDPRFAGKTAGLPPYQPGEWRDKKPRDNMRTISSQLAAEFIHWVITAGVASDAEFDFYECDEFHDARYGRGLS